MKKERSLKGINYYIIIVLLFIIDLAVFSYLEKPLIYSLLSFYIFQLAYPLGIVKIIVSCMLLSLESFIYYGRFGLDLLFILPATFIGIRLAHILYNSVWQFYLLLIVCLLAKITLIEWLILGQNVNPSYTISLVFANIGVVWIMSYSNYLKSKN